MNFDKKTPFIIFVLLYFACLLSQIQHISTDQPNPSLYDLHSSTKELQDSNDKIQIINFKKQNDKIDNMQTGIEIGSVSLQKEGQTESVTSSTFAKDYNKQYTKRLLQSNITTNNRFITISTLIFQSLLSISRNFIFIGIITNSIQLFLPYIILCQSFLMLAFWNCQKHYLTTLYSNVFCSYWDLFNAIRLIAKPNTSTNLMLSQYGFSSNLIFNLSGQMLVGLLLLVFTIISKFFSVCLKHERLRAIAANLRSIWNGFFFAILPRVATFVGLHWKLGAMDGYSAIDTTICCLISMLIVFYFVMLIIQTRRIRQKKQLLEQRKNELGLAKRINHKRQFRFDCLRYSSLYYPSMRYVLLLLYFLPIGLSWDFYYVSFGGPIIAQLTIMMFEVSSTPYILLRDKIISPIYNFLMVIVHLCIITVGLAESVSHSEVSQIAETVLFSLLMFVLGSSLLGTGMDVWIQIKSRCNNVKEQVKKDESSVHNFTMKIGKKKSEESSVKKSNQSEEEQSQENQYENRKTSTPLKKDTELFSNKLKIHKVRKGKVI